MRWTVPQHVLVVPFLIFCTALSSQSDPRSTFHISGTVTRLGIPRGNDWVAFEGPSKTSVKADPAGHYEADLPLGVWKVGVTDGITREWSLSHPRVFRVTKHMDVLIDLYVNAVGCGGVHIITRDGRPPTPEEEEQKNENCQGRAFFPLPSDDGVPFEVVLGGKNHSLCSSQIDILTACDREFGTYNLLTVYADRVTFTPFPKGGPMEVLRGGLLEAKGDVLVHDGEREYRRNSVRFLMSDGKAVEAY